MISYVALPIGRPIGNPLPLWEKTHSPFPFFVQISLINLLSVSYQEQKRLSLSLVTSQNLGIS